MNRIYKHLSFSFLMLALPACEVEETSPVVDEKAEVDDESGTSTYAEAADETDAMMFGEGPDDLASPVHPDAASCVGYYNGGNYCLASCWDNPSYWVPVGHITNTAYGNCGAKVDAYCAWHSGTYGACWGWP